LQAQLAASARREPRFPPHFDKSSLLKLTADCKDLDGYVTLFEALLSMEEVPVEEWKFLLIGQLDVTHKLRVAELVADGNSTYDDLVGALRVSGGIRAYQLPKSISKQILTSPGSRTFTKG